MLKTDRERLLGLAHRRGFLSAKAVVQAGFHTQQLTRLVARACRVERVMRPYVETVVA